MANAVDEIRIGNRFVDVISPSSTFEYDQWAAQYPGVGLPGDDTDGDGLTNETERSLGTNPLLADTDGDGGSDGAEVAGGSNPLAAQSTLADTDGDALPDAWEMTHFGNLSHDGTADSDNDLLIDSLEFTLGLNPNDADSNDDNHLDWMGIPGYLWVEQWNNVTGANLTDLFASSAFHGAPSEVYLVTQAKAQSNVGDNYGLRLSGRVIAPVSGSYCFWIASDGQCRLYLSTDSTASKRRLVASVNTGSGVEQWDQDSSQKSVAIDLVAGQEYYLEALMKESTGVDHLALAWDYPGQARQIIPGAQLRSYVSDPGDADGDGMLDTWEATVGLDPNDNGQLDYSQSAYADSDGDGLLSFEEYNYNGSPLVAGGNQGYLELNIWNGISGPAIKDLTGNPKYASAPDSKTYSGVDVSCLGLNYGARLRGTITAPQTGDYVFTIAGDEQTELWLSSTESPFTKRRIAHGTTKTNYQQWLTGTRQSAGIHLEQSKSYYIEALVKNATGTDHLSIGWSRIAESEWQVANIGSGTTSAWSVNSATGAFHGSTIGGDIRYASDKCTYRYVQLQGDCEMTARIPSLESSNASAKVGLMIRESLAADSTLALAHLTKDGRIALHYRGATGGQIASNGGMSAGQPYQWLRIARTGSVLTGYCSLDGLSWKLVGTCTISMAQNVYVGMAIATLKPWLTRALQDGSTLATPIRVSAITAAGILAPGDFLPLIRNIAWQENGNLSHRLPAIAAIGQAGDAQDLPKLRQIAAVFPALHRAAHDAVATLTSRLASSH
jgi:PA14 domain/Bacterial TSP3 repeat